MDAFRALPPEIQLKIFSYLTLEELCETVLPACDDDDGLEELVYDALIRNEVSFYRKWMNGVSIDKYSRALKRKPAAMTQATVYPLRDSHLPIILNHLPSLSRLTTLKLKLRSYHYPPIYSIVTQCLHLKELWFHVIPGFVDSFSHLLSSLPHLTRLSVHLGELYDGALVDQTIDAIAIHSPLLQRLRVIGRLIDDDRLERLLLRHQASLTHFKLDSEIYTNKAIQMISQCPHLESLSIDHCYYVCTLSPLKSLSKLTSLYICSIPFLDDLESVILFLPQLTYLKLKKITLPEQMFINIAKNCLQLKTLIVINCNNRMTDPMIAALLTCRSLHSLVLYTNHQLTADSIEKLSIAHFPILKVKNCAALSRGQLSMFDYLCFDDSIEPIV